MADVCLHGHFYQPTRVNPWTGEYDALPSATPYSDWNQRIAAECYGPVAAARLLDEAGQTRAFRNLYPHLSFDIGPTLLEWMEIHAPTVLRGIQEADRDAIDRYGHGGAIAQPYHHPILPLCDAADRRTEIAWGLAVFQRVFGRAAEGMWLPETAVDTATLEAVYDAGVKFVLVAPHQLSAIRPKGGKAAKWTPVKEAEPGAAYEVPLPSGNSVVLVVYDGGLSHGVAFGGWLHDGGKFADRLADTALEKGLALVATDGESYGHHHPRGEMALAYAVEQLEAREDVQLTNLAAWLAQNPPQWEAQVTEDSSWSCAHGVERWRSDCGCRAQPDAGLHQEWRRPFRAALDAVRTDARAALAPLGKTLFKNPEAARNAYGEVVGNPAAFVGWYADHAAKGGTSETARQWLEIHRHLLAMYTSCAWFFDELTGLEPKQNLRHAACAIGQLRDLTGVNLESKLTRTLDQMPANGDTLSLVTAVQQGTRPPAKKSDAIPTGQHRTDRRAGILHPVSALPNQGPIGDLDGAVPFLDWAVEAGFSLWQILPLGPTDGWGSPYSSWSALSGNPDLVGLEWLRNAGLLASDAILEGGPRVDYGATVQDKRPLVLEAAATLVDRPDHPLYGPLSRFIESAQWATDAALFYALKRAQDDAPWWDWPADIRRFQAEAVEAALDTHATEVATWRAALFLFERQWNDVRLYAAARGVELVGDMPIYVGHDSVDVWTNQSLFAIDDKGHPTKVAGVPPDAYSDVGQRWGNPLFDWERMAADGYAWWIERVSRNLALCDHLRIDHFIGFSRYWEIPADAEDARSGQWVPGPGRAVFDAIADALGHLPLVAEDLGQVDPGTVELRDALGLPGMKVLQFGYDDNPDNPHRLDNHPICSVVYPSTHDSPTARGWWESLDHGHQQWLGLGNHGWDVADTLNQTALSSPAKWAILATQDALCLDNSTRFNVPGTTDGNWTWRLFQDQLDAGRASALRRQVRASGRLSPQAHREDTSSTTGGGARAGLEGPTVAYFCMEYGIDAALPIYSGGLGVLAGDIVKAAGDQDRDFIALGMLWGEGYFVQRLDADGRQIAEYIPTPRTRLRPTGIEIQVRIGHDDVRLTAWRVTGMGSVELLLLEPIDEHQRWLTARLYGGDARQRVMHELILGVGGVRALRALGHTIDVYHFNEGHALFAGLELIREKMSAGRTFEEALEETRREVVFTTHTPVPAGNEVHPLQTLWDLGVHLDTLSWDQLKFIGGDPFEMTPAALRLSRIANAVAELHGETARAMWAHVPEAAPIHAITNGVHMPTWQDGEIARLARSSDTDKLWARHQRLKTDLMAEIDQRTGVRLDPNVLTIGFARRAATYKRANLLLRDEKWLSAMAASKTVQFVFAGKAHPRDGGGQALIADIVAASRRHPETVVFIENYDMILGASLTRGCDVWLNNPVRPKEASGTSGMKATANGVLNLSILDGWWDEGCAHGVNGWGVGAPPAGTDADDHDYYALRGLLEDEVLPAYTDREQWTQMMRNAVASATERFSSGRLVRRYFDEMYLVTEPSETT